MTDRVGQQFGSYQLVKLLGRGGQASVYLGKHRYLNSYAALKVLNARICPGDESKFLSEAQTLADLRHPNIVHLLDFCIEDGIPVLIMDYALKGSLRQYAPHGTSLPLTTVVNFVSQIAGGLQYAHNHHVIHRDVKPENILLDADDRLLLSDFGLSLLTPSSEELSTQDPAGTARYMAPEQLRGKPSMASDQYALAVMTYEWLCGELPFHGNMWEIWQQHLHSDPPLLRSIRPELPLMLEQVVQRALAKKPQDRFVSVQAFALALARASQTLTPIADNDSQITAPFQAITQSLPSAPLHHAVTLPPEDEQRAQIPTVPQAKDPLRAADLQNRVRMLGRLRRTFGDLMTQSLQGAAWLDLGLAAKPDAVQNAAHLLLHLSNRVVQHLPSGTSITQVYDEAEHELLILGEPGAGKSTLLLDLAQQLLVRAEQDQTHPLPVILPLSTWAVKRPRLADWIAEQLSQIYDVPRKLSVQWVEENAILPLLDGFDEMEEAARPACIAAINTYHRDHLAQLVVCSRTTEYEAAAEYSRLALQGAVIAQPLTLEDVDAYLVRVGQGQGQALPLLAGLRSALKHNTALHVLSTIPLMLNILILTYRGASMHDLPNRESLLQKAVWNDYVQRMVTRKGNSILYPLEKTRARLSYLAQQMRDHNQTVFYLEHLQPNWLGAYQQRTYAALAVRLPAIFIGVLVSILVSLFFFGDTKLVDISTYLEYGSWGGMLGGIWSESVAERGKKQANDHVWRKQLVTRLVVSACIGLIHGLSLALHLRFFAHPTPDQWQTGALSYGVAIGLGILLLQYLFTASFRPNWFSRNSVPQLWQRFVDFFYTVQGPHVLLVVVIIGLGNALTLERFYRPSAGLRIGLSYGLVYALISLTLRAQVADIHLTDRIRWTWKSLLRGLFNARHLRISLWLISIGTIFGGLAYGLSIGLSMMSIGLSYWGLLGLFQGIAQEQIENQDRRIANQGIRRSLRNSVMMGLIGGTIIGLIGVLNYGLVLGLNHVLSSGLKIELISGLNPVLSYGLQLGICGALLICLLTGGLAVQRHYTIRLLLSRSHTFPWNAPQFLDDATARFLLRRVGGGYSFSHRLLLDHFADTEK